VAIKPEAYNSTGFTYFEFDYTPTIANVVFQVSKTTDPLLSTYVDDVEMVLVSLLDTNIQDSADFSYAPNPAKTHIKVAASEAIVSVAMINSLGQQVSTTHIGANDGTIDVANLARGVYILKANIANATITRKVVIE